MNNICPSLKDPENNPMCTLGKQCVFQDYLWSIERGLAGSWVTRKPSEKKNPSHSMDSMNSMDDGFLIDEAPFN